MRVDNAVIKREHGAHQEGSAVIGEHDELEHASEAGGKD
jgi:hypothetical protein